MEPLYVGLGVIAVILTLVAVFTHPGRRSGLSFLLGVCAGLVEFQVFRIHVFTILAVIWMCLPRGAASRYSVRRVTALGISVLLVASTTLLGELVNSPTLALQLLGLAASAIIVALRATRDDARIMLWGLLVIATVGSVVGILQVLKVVPTDLWHLEISTVGRPTGIYPEPDWLGMYAGLGVILSWRLSMSRAGKVIFTVLNSGALVLAMARASWVALVVTVLLALIVSMAYRRGGAFSSKLNGSRRGRVAAVGVATLTGIIALSAVPQLQEDLVRRASTMMGTVQETDISGQARIRQNDSLMSLAESVPVYGHGLSAAGRVGAWGQLDAVGDAKNNVASNWILGMWVDGAWFALPLIIFLIALALLRIRTLPGQLLLFCLVSSLFSNAMFFPVTWLLIGLAITAGFRLIETGRSYSSANSFAT